MAAGMCAARVYREIYSLDNIWRRLPRARSQLMPYLLFNLFYRKWGAATERMGRLIGFDRIWRNRPPRRILHPVIFGSAGLWGMSPETTIRCWPRHSCPYFFPKTLSAEKYLPYF